MIVTLNGTLLSATLPTAVVDVHGVGYGVELPHSCWHELPPLGANLTLFTRLIVREDAHLLFGFLTAEKRDVFNEIVKISGVGPKLALTILSAMSIDQLVHAVQKQDAKLFMLVKGIGTKVAQRLVLDLKGRFDGWQVSSSPENTMEGEAIAALIVLGYSPGQAERAVRAVDGAKDTEMLVRLALQKVRS
jgi:Holliday junction DNA helicase RuvA